MPTWRARISIFWKKEACWVGTSMAVRQVADDMVFTVEQSVRSTQTIVYEILNISKAVPSLCKGMMGPRVLFGAMEVLFS